MSLLYSNRNYTNEDKTHFFLDCPKYNVETWNCWNLSHNSMMPLMALMLYFFLIYSVMQNYYMLLI